MANVLKHEKKQQVVALGRLGWSLRRIEETTGVRRETASRYLKAAGVATRRPGRWGHPPAPSSDPKAAIEVSTDSSARERPPARSPTASACTAYADLIEEAVRKGRTALSIWQDLVDQPGFRASYSSMWRFVRKLRGERTHEAHPVIVTAAGEDYVKTGVMCSRFLQRCGQPSERVSPLSIIPLELGTSPPARGGIRCLLASVQDPS
jgi:hypothetical protein